jgi:ribosomal protein L29
MGDLYNMALLKYSEIKKMDKKQIKEKMKELKFELVKANVTANKASAKTKEIKRAIARLITSLNSEEFKGLKVKPSIINTSKKEVLKT